MKVLCFVCCLFLFRQFGLGSIQWWDWDICSLYIFIIFLYIYIYTCVIIYACLYVF